MLWSDALGGWMLLKYDDVKTALRNSAQFSSFQQQGRRVTQQRPGVAGLDAPTLLSTDPPDHTRLRRLLDDEFTPRVIGALTPRVQAIVDSQLQALV